MLEVQNLTKKYGKYLAADSISFQVSDGSVGILLGPNGAGKSTVIKSIAGLLRYKGEIRIAGYPARSVQAKSQFGYVPEIPAMFEHLTVAEHMQYIRMAYNSEITDEEVTRIFERFEMNDKLEKLGSELSKGMMQKVSICCALAIKPRVLMLDEPMVGLDPAAIEELKVVIRELKESGTTILLSTHMLDMVEGLWDEVFILETGKVVASYKREEVEEEDIKSLFFKVTGGEERDE